MTPEDYAHGLCESLNRTLPGAHAIFEPGRSSSAGAESPSTALAWSSAAAATTWVAVDGGMSDNPRPALYGARYSALVSNRAADPSTGAFAVCGKHCESGDVLIEQTELANPRRGDVLATPATGAYALSMASNYNAQPRAAAVLLSNGVTSGRAREFPAEIVGESS